MRLTLCLALALVIAPQPSLQAATPAAKWPHITQQQGVWRGTFRRYDADGRLTDTFPSEITMRVIPKNGKLMYHQTNHYFPQGKPEEVIESYGEVRGNKVYFGNGRLEAWKMDVPGDPTGRSAVILMDYKDGSGMYAHEIVSVSADGKHRARATQYLVDGRIVRRTLIDEEKLTEDWASYDAAHPRPAATTAVPGAAPSATPTAAPAASSGRVEVTSIPKVLVRSPNPVKLAEFYTALGFAEVARNETSVNFYLAGNVGALEVLKMDPATQPSGPKTSRTQQGVVAIFEVTDQAALLARAKAAGATLIERWDAADRPATIYYIGDPENNILGFAARHHHPRINTP